MRRSSGVRTRGFAGGGGGSEVMRMTGTDAGVASELAVGLTETGAAVATGVAFIGCAGAADLTGVAVAVCGKVSPAAVAISATFFAVAAVCVPAAVVTVATVVT